MTLYNLTEEQCLMMDAIWQLETPEQMRDFKDALLYNEQLMFETLVQMLLEDTLEGQTLDNTSMAKIMLTDIGIKCI
ncbi:hypothetical protein N9I00_01295 [bacterium]|nr:hypothetical protein [bacterium]